MNAPRVLILVPVLLGACASMQDDRHARELAGNRVDDGYCVDHGLHYPDPGYLQCRRQLVDRRLHRDWQNLQMLRQAGQPALGDAAVPAFRYPDPAGFHCHPEPQFGNDYVFCGYDDLR